jgi:hypothetical protein
MLIDQPLLGTKSFDWQPGFFKRQRNGCEGHDEEVIKAGDTVSTAHVPDTGDRVGSADPIRNVLFGMFRPTLWRHEVPLLGEKSPP